MDLALGPKFRYFIKATRTYVQRVVKEQKFLHYFSTSSIIASQQLVKAQVTRSSFRFVLFLRVRAVQDDAAKEVEPKKRNQLLRKIVFDAAEKTRDE